MILDFFCFCFVAGFFQFFVVVMNKKNKYRINVLETGEKEMGDSQSGPVLVVWCDDARARHPTNVLQMGLEFIHNTEWMTQFFISILTLSPYIEQPYAV